jgi:D-alanyl-D-alanine carboxypeptidase (penicillin-binding protein 5/6)
MKNFWLIIVMVAMSAFQSSCTVADGGMGSGPDSGGEAFIALEAHSGKVTAARNELATRPIGTLAQVATAVVVFDWATATGESLAQQTVVSPGVLAVGGKNPMGLQPGDQIALRDALYSMLLGSDSASAQTLAEHVGRQILERRGGFGGDPVATFVDEMNELSAALGMRRTTFRSPHGLEPQGNVSLSTVEDLARLGVYAMRHPGLVFYSEQKSRKIGYQRGGQQMAFRVSNTNGLVGRQNIDGLRAGQSPLTGPSLIISANRKPIVEKLPNNRSRITKRRMLVVVLGSSNNEGRALELLNAGWPAYDQWVAMGGVAMIDPNTPNQLLTVPELQ